MSSAFTILPGLVFSFLVVMSPTVLTKFSWNRRQKKKKKKKEAGLRMEQWENVSDKDLEVTVGTLMDQYRSPISPSSDFTHSRWKKNISRCGLLPSPHMAQSYPTEWDFQSGKQPSKELKCSGSGQAHAPALRIVSRTGIQESRVRLWHYSRGPQFLSSPLITCNSCVCHLGYKAGAIIKEAEH